MTTSRSREANVTFKISGADESRQNIDKIRQSVEDFGEEGVRAAQNLVSPLENIQSEFDRVNRKISEGRAITDRDARAMIQQFDLLENEIRKVFGTVERAPKEFQEAFGRAQKQIDGTKTKIRELTDAVDDQKGHLTEGGERWGNLGDAIERVAGKQGKYVAVAGMVTAAWREGWQLGMKLNQLFGTDMSLWEESSARFGAKLGALVKAVADDIVAVGNVLLALKSGSIAEIKGALGELKNAASSHFRVLSDAVNEWGADWDRLHPKIKANADAIKDHTEETNRNTTAIQDNSRAIAEAKEHAEKLVEQQAKLKDQLDETAASLKKEEDALHDSLAAEINAEHGVINRTSDMQAFQREIDGVSSALKKQQDEVESLTSKYGANDPMALQAIDRQRQLEHSLHTSGDRFNSAKDDVDRYEQAQRQAHDAVERHRQKLSELADQQAREQTQLTTLTAAATAAADAAVHAATSIQGIAAPAGAMANATQKLAEHGPSANTAVQGLGTAASSAATPTGEVARNASELATALGRIDGAQVSLYGELARHLQAIATQLAACERSLPGVVSGLQKIADLGSDDASAGGSSEWPQGMGAPQ